MDLLRAPTVNGGGWTPAPDRRSVLPADGWIVPLGELADLRGVTALVPTCALSIPDVPPGIVIVIEKGAYRMGVYRDGALADATDGPACFAIAMGGNPVGDKERQGDERTPEGWFRVTHKNPKSAFHLSLGLNYPTARHAAAGLSAGIIDRDTAARVTKADDRGGMPIRDSALGGDIYLHGGGSFPSWWTDGCVAIANREMDWLFTVAGAGAPVWIRP